MKSEFVIQDFGGKHNADVDATRARLIKGSSWKKARTIVIIPSANLISARICLSIWNLIFPPNNGVLRILALGMEVGDAYSQAIENILGHPELSQWEYVLTLEHDNAPPCDGVIKLVDAMQDHPELAAIGGLYYTKGENGVAQIWGDITDPMPNYRPQPPRHGEIVECFGLGMGFTLFRLSMFKDKRIERPLFKTLAGQEGVGTQDLQFWGKARKFGYRCAVHCDVKVGHLDVETGIMW